jgi:3D-(3,5/4)-trihydroxycyclohexane-1,2-dione acylhydrolase (decyclizing)
VERDGRRSPFFAGIFGIFGHGNVAGMGEALEAVQDDFRYYQARNEQAMVHAAVAYIRVHELDRSRCHQPGDRRGRGHGQPHPGAAAAG